MNWETGGVRQQRCLSCSFCKAPWYKVSSHSPISPYHCTYRLDISIIEKKRLSSCFSQLLEISHLLCVNNINQSPGWGWQLIASKPPQKSLALNRHLIILSLFFIRADGWYTSTKYCHLSKLFLLIFLGWVGVVVSRRLTTSPGKLWHSLIG